ncbi:MAG: ATP-binding protein [Nitrososphaeria archaeon]
MDIRSYLITRKERIDSINVVPRASTASFTKDLITSIIGPRRSGKTFYLYYLIKSLNLKKEDYLFINFEEVFDRVDAENLVFIHKEIYGKEPEYLFFDEVQSLNSWEHYVYSLYESKRHYIFLTGSSSKLLSREIATQLRGRSLPFYIYPFSFAEILKQRGIKIDKETMYNRYRISEIMRLLENVLINGTFPDIVLNNVEPSKFVANYIDLVIYKDIIQRYNIKNRYALEFLVKSSISSMASKFSINKVHNTLKSQNVKVGKNLLYSFQKILSDIQFAFYLRKYHTDQSVRRVELSIPKAYLVDNALYSFIEYKRDLGKLMENFVLLELVKAGYEVNKNIFYFEDKNAEVDFVIKKDRVEELVQVSYANDKVEEREYSNLAQASSMLNCSNLTIITWDIEDKMTVDNKEIRLIPLWKWLLTRADLLQG